MSIPLDRLYHYIESVAQEIRGDNVVIYRFWPHGSKKIDDLGLSHNNMTFLQHRTSPEIICHDQEPLDYQRYQNVDSVQSPEMHNFLSQHYPHLVKKNLRKAMGNIYDQCILLHSEKRSTEVDVYNQNNFIPVYYWSHAVIAQDWFRYAQHANFRKNQQLKKFLIYNRAWSGTREYRVKFVDQLIQENLVDFCQTTFNPLEPELNLHYSQYEFVNPAWRPTNPLNRVFPKTQATSTFSADIEVSDYNNTEFEVVLETLFDDSRLHLTEKTLRPIACGQPFVLVATQGSLAYLRNYGFKTFDGIIDESYDSIVDPVERMQAVIETMKKITAWTPSQHQTNMQQIQQIVNYNQQHFFSDKFNCQVLAELKNNLQQALHWLESSNTSEMFFDIRKKAFQDPAVRDKHLGYSKSLTAFGQPVTRQDLLKMVQHARKYYNQHANK